MKIYKRFAPKRNTGNISMSCEDFVELCIANKNNDSDLVISVVYNNKWNTPLFYKVGDLRLDKLIQVPISLPNNGFTYKPTVIVKLGTPLDMQIKVPKTPKTPIIPEQFVRRVYRYPGMNTSFSIPKSTDFQKGFADSFTHEKPFALSDCLLFINGVPFTQK